MFTGIILATGTISDIEDNGGDRIFSVEVGSMDITDVAEGDSICVNGVCLTVVSMAGPALRFDVSSETLACTTFNSLGAGARVNLEKAMKLNDRLGGHIVSGHVDATGTIVSSEQAARSIRYFIELPGSLKRYICEKGSVCIDGVSLTVNEVNEDRFSVNIIPHTLEETIFSDYKAGDKVNIEVDIIARYLERLHSG